MSDHLSAGERRWSLAAVMVSALGVGLMVGTTLPLCALVLEARGVSKAMIGLNAATGTLAILVCGPLYPRLLARLGMVRAFVLGTLASAGGIIALPYLPDLGHWFVLRFLIGMANGLSWVASETWVNAATQERHRAFANGLYSTILLGGFAGGPAILALVGSEGVLPFAVAAGAVLLAGVPLLPAWRVQPRLSQQSAGRPMLALVLAAPVPLLAAFASGLTESSAFSLMAIYGLEAALPEAAAVLLLAVFLAGNVGLQIPLGWLADRWDRGRMLRLCAAAGVIGPLGLALAIGTPAAWPLLFLWGGTVTGLYTIGLTRLGASVAARDLAAANAAFVMFYCAGSMAGPSLSGLAMDIAGPQGLVATMSGASAAFLAVAFAILRLRPAAG